MLNELNDQHAGSNDLTTYLFARELVFDKGDAFLLRLIALLPWFEPLRPLVRRILPHSFRHVVLLVFLWCHYPPCRRIVLVVARSRWGRGSRVGGDAPGTRQRAQGKDARNSAKGQCASQQHLSLSDSFAMVVVRTRAVGMATSFQLLQKALVAHDGREFYVPADCRA